MSKVFLGCHVVFATKHRKRTIPMEKRKILYAYIYKILQNHNCYTYRINGFVDHVHILFDLNPTIALADLIRDIKRSTTLMLRNDEQFPDFESWGSGYFAGSVGKAELQSVLDYVLHQEKHHTIENKDFMTEMQWMVEYHGLQWYPDDWA